MKEVEGQLSRVFMLGFACDESYFRAHSAADPVQHYAGRKLEERYINGLRENGYQVDSASAFPASAYPKNPKAFFGFGKFRYESGEAGYLIPYINFPLLRMPTRFLASFVISMMWVLKNIAKPKVLVLYSLHSPFVFTAFLMRVFFGVRFYPIVTDFPEFMSNRKGVARFLKNLDGKFILNLGRWASGFSFVSSQAAQFKPAWSKIPHVVIEGVAESNVHPLSSQLNSTGGDKSRIFYSGGLSEDYGVKDLVDALRYLPDNIEILICGRGALQDYIREAARNDSRVKYLGFVDPSKVKEIASGCRILINPRRLDKDFVSLSFPSKLIEYMTYGVPVLTTRIPSIPSQYEQFLFFIDAEGAEGVARGILNVLNSTEADLINKTRLAQLYVKNSLNPAAQAKRFATLFCYK